MKNEKNMNCFTWHSKDVLETPFATINFSTGIKNWKPGKFIPSLSNHYDKIILKSNSGKGLTKFEIEKDC